MLTRSELVITALGLIAVTAPPAVARQDGAPVASSSLMANVLNSGGGRGNAVGSATRNDAAASAYSMLYVPPAGPRDFAKHDLVQVIVRESTVARSKHELETEKDYNIDGAIKAWPHFDIVDMLQLQLAAGNTSPLPELSAEFSKDFDGEGEYERRDDLTTRITAEIIEILPNGNLVLEARSSITNDEESATIKMTGICRAQDVSAVNTVLSTQIYSLTFEKIHTGELKKANEKGILTKIFDFFFAW